jgi:hypothetical protein
VVKGVQEMIRTYQELKQLQTFEERYKYLRIGGTVGKDSFGYDRYINQLFYTSSRWKKTRDKIIIRDGGCDLGLEDYPIRAIIIIHHMNQVTLEDIELDRDILYDPEFLISTSLDTHNAIHYGNLPQAARIPIERKRNDTCPWRL